MRGAIEHTNTRIRFRVGEPSKTAQTDCTPGGPFVRGVTYGTPPWNYNILILAYYAQSTASGQGLIKSIPFTLAP